jgi:UDP-N-acetylmuramoyl-tripeptide--D-alanyl-D-alanine ligase
MRRVVAPADSEAAALLWTRDTAVVATGGRCDADFVATGVSIDTRSLRPGDLFVALTAERDGHDFVARALEQGASAALVSHVPAGVAPDAPLILVPDVLAGLCALGVAARARFGGRLVAVTGSVGKTGSKEMLRTALSAQGRVHAAEKSYNNHWGVPLTLARMPADADFAVIEIGMNAPGEIAPLARLARPHVAMVTTVEAVHLAAFRDLRGIAREKAAIFAGLEPGGTAVLNRDTPTYPILLAAARRAGARPVRFGRSGRPEFRLGQVQVGATGTCAAASARGRRFLFRLAAPGRHLAMNALGVLAAVEALGGDLALGAVALDRWQAPEGRGERFVVALGPGGIDGEIVLVDESYNANPAAMAAAFEMFAAARPVDGPGRITRGRRIAFLGDMLELGPDELALHAGLASAPAIDRISPVHCVGERMRALHAALPPGLRGEWFASSEAAAARVPALLDAGDVVMVKGSRGARLDRVVEAIKRMGAVRPLGMAEA